MLENIRHCFEAQKVTSFYCDQEDRAAHLTGYIVGFNEAEILIAHISAHGYYDGYILKHVKDIYRIDCAGEYENKIEKLYKYRKQSHDAVLSLGQVSGSILDALLDFAGDNGLLVSLELGNSCLSGRVSHYNEDTIMLDIVDDYGIRDGQSIVVVDEIETVSVDTDDEQDLSILSHPDVDAFLGDP